MMAPASVRFRANAAINEAAPGVVAERPIVVIGISVSSVLIGFEERLRWSPPVDLVDRVETHIFLPILRYCFVAKVCLVPKINVTPRDDLPVIAAADGAAIAVNIRDV